MIVLSPGLEPTAVIDTCVIEAEVRNVGSAIGRLSRGRSFALLVCTKAGVANIGRAPRWLTKRCANSRVAAMESSAENARVI